MNSTFRYVATASALSRRWSNNSVEDPFTLKESLIILAVVFVIFFSIVGIALLVEYIEGERTNMIWDRVNTLSVNAGKVREEWRVAQNSSLA